PVFSQLIKYLPKATIYRLAKKHRSDHYCKKFNSYYHLIVMLFSSFQKCNSLRELITGLMAWQNRLQHLGFTFYPRRSTLSDANTNRTHQFFEDVYYALHDRYKHLFLPDSRRNKDRIH